nr:MAG TPA: hypothetical protein [Crassvirales sp.]
MIPGYQCKDSSQLHQHEEPYVSFERDVISIIS